MSIFKAFANMARKSNEEALDKHLEKINNYDNGNYPHVCVNCEECSWGDSRYYCSEHDFKMTTDEAKKIRCNKFKPVDYWLIEY